MSVQGLGRHAAGGGPIAGPVAALTAWSFRRRGLHLRPNLQTTPVVLLEPKS
jgi:uncharacterized protein (TIGR03382 family)